MERQTFERFDEYKNNRREKKKSKSQTETLLRKNKFDKQKLNTHKKNWNQTAQEAIIRKTSTLDVHDAPQSIYVYLDIVPTPKYTSLMPLQSSGAPPSVCTVDLFVRFSRKYHIRLVEQPQLISSQSISVWLGSTRRVEEGLRSSIRFFFWLYVVEP